MQGSGYRIQGLGLYLLKRSPTTALAYTKVISFGSLKKSFKQGCNPETLDLYETASSEPEAKYQSYSIVGATASLAKRLSLHVSYYHYNNLHHCHPPDYHCVVPISDTAEL